MLRPRCRNLIVVGDVSLSLSKGCIGFPQPLLRVYSHHGDIFLSHCPFARLPFNLVRLLLELAKQHCYGFEAFEDRLSVKFECTIRFVPIHLKMQMSSVQTGANVNTCPSGFNFFSAVIQHLQLMIQLLNRHNITQLMS